MHGYGKYEWQLSGQKYEGQMYANDKEGYGSVSYPSGARFEGLFRNDQRFGPGVYTDVAGYQDVGIWQNEKLIRLARSLSFDLAIPSLVRSDEDTRVLRHRRIVDLSNKKVEQVAINMLDSLRHSRAFDDRMFVRAEELYNWQCRDDEVLWFNQISFMAWNNNPLMIDVQTHVFRHRKFEKELSFDVKQILAGRRNSFRKEGSREKANMEFLIACSNGITSKIVDLLYSHKLDVDVTDNRGNTGLFFAAVDDRLDAIDILLDFGADVDGTNDECLTPLGLSVLRLLALIHNVTDWSSSFLPSESCIQTEPMTRDMEQQSSYNNTDSSTDQRKALEMITINPESSGALKSTVSSKNINSQNSEKQNFVFNFTPTQLRRNKANGNNVKSHRRTDGTTSNKLEKLGTDVAKKEKVYATILKLLSRGADPNLANVPYPVLIMALFSKSPSLVTAFLEHGANPNVSLSKENYHLTPLLILAGSRPSHENTLMAKALLNSNANPSSRADCDYCQELIIDAKSSQTPELLDNSQGLTALHFLALNARKHTAEENKHSSELIKSIYQYGHFKHSDLYQGHSPLSLAILKGNLTTGKAILETGCIDVNEQLGPDFGNVMLMLESCWLQKLLTPAMIQKFLKLLVEYGGCPLASAKVSEVEYNQVEYGRMELGKMLKEVGTGIKKYRKSSTEAARTGDFSKSMDFVQSIAREQLNKHIISNYVKNLEIATTDRSQTTIIDERVFQQARRWRKEKDFFNDIKTINYSQNKIEKLVNILSNSDLSLHQESTDAMKKNRDGMPIKRIMSLNKLSKKMRSQIYTDFRKAIDVQSDDVNNYASDIDDSSELDRGTDMFKVCYNCFATHGKMLILCPECELVYFCSEECNVSNTEQIKNPHQCPVFYDEEKLRLITSAGIRDIDPLSCMIKKFPNSKFNTNSPQYNEEYIIQNGMKNFRKSRRNINVRDEIGKMKLTKNSSLDKRIDKNEYSAESKIENDCISLKGKKNDESVNEATGDHEIQTNENVLKKRGNNKINKKRDLREETKIAVPNVNHDIDHNRSERMKIRNCKNNELEGTMDLQRRMMMISDSSNDQLKDKNVSKWNELSVKNVDWLLRVKKCSDDTLDIDTILLPYTGFVQGDSYYRILPVGEDHKITDNYSFV